MLEVALAPAGLRDRRVAVVRVLVTVPWGESLGGAEALLQSVLDGARENGHELELLFFEPGPWPEQLASEGFRVEVFRSGRLHQIHRWAWTVARLACHFRARRPEVILNWSAKTQLYGSPAALLAGMADRVLWWQHSIPTGGWLDRAATRLPAAAIGCCSAAAAEAQKRLHPARPTLLVKAGAAVPDELERGEPPMELSGSAPVVGLVGRLESWKGQDRLLRAQALLRERGHELQVAIVGGDAYGFSREYAVSLPALVSRLGLEDMVTLTGQVPDAGPYMRQMDILVNASDPEPFGIVLLEGMARGVAVVAIDSGGPAEFIEDGQTGVLARSGEPDALADALEPLLVSPELRERLARAGRERFLRELTDVAMRERFFAALESVGASS